jgi:hypothetical protein
MLNTLRSKLFVPLTPAFPVGFRTPTGCAPGPSFEFGQILSRPLPTLEASGRVLNSAHNEGVSTVCDVE